VAAVSGRVIVEDPVHLAAQAAAGSALGLTDHATPFDAWARRLGEWAGSIDWAEQVAPWLASEVDGAGASELKRVLGSDTPADAERREATARPASSEERRGGQESSARRLQCTKQRTG